MAITVDGYGEITSSNAYDIYKQYRQGSLQLNTAQQKKCQSLLSKEQKDEIEYDPTVKKNNGKSQINTEGAEDEGANTGEAAVAVAASTGSLAGLLTSLITAKAASGTNGYVACTIATTVGMICTLAALAMSFLFDSDLKDRKARSDEAESTDEVIDSHSQGLTDNMDQMNEDAETYQGQVQEYTQTVNGRTADMTGLQQEIMEREAAGDKKGAEKLKDKLKKLQKADDSQQLADMDATKENMEQYAANNSESQGVNDAGNTVATFLKQGRGMGTAAYVCAGLSTAATIVCAIAAAISAIPKLPFGIDEPGGAMASVIWGVCGAMCGMTASNYFSKASDEMTCADNGDTMADKLSNLNGLIPQQEQYQEDTKSDFEKQEEASAESQSEAQEKSQKALAKTKKKITKQKQKDKKTDKKDDKKNDNSKVGAGTGGRGGKDDDNGNGGNNGGGNGNGGNGSGGNK